MKNTPRFRSGSSLKRHMLAVLAAGAMSAGAQTVTTEMRNWTDATGRVLSAALRGYDAGNVIFQTAEGKRACP